MGFPGQKAPDFLPKCVYGGGGVLLASLVTILEQNYLDTLFSVFREQ